MFTLESIRVPELTIIQLLFNLNLEGRKLKALQISDLPNPGNFKFNVREYRGIFSNRTRISLYLSDLCEPLHPGVLQLPVIISGRKSHVFRGMDYLENLALNKIRAANTGVPNPLPVCPCLHKGSFKDWGWYHHLIGGF